MATDMDALDILEKKIMDLEQKVYGVKCEPDESITTVIDSLLQANTMMTAALSGRDKFSIIFKRINELNDYLELNPLSEGLTDLNTKLNIIYSMKSELEENIEIMEKINEMKSILNDDKIKNIQPQNVELTNLLSQHLTLKDKLNDINNEVNDVLVVFNEVCLEISKSFFLLNESIAKLEAAKK